MFYKISCIFFIILLACSRPINTAKEAHSSAPKVEKTEPIKQIEDYRPHYFFKKQKLDTADLSVHRALNFYVDSMATSTKSVKLINGFRVQIYVGNDKEEANNAKAFIYNNFLGIDPYLSYDIPIYRVRFGDFSTYEYATKYLHKIKKEYPAAIIVRDRIDIKKIKEIQF